MKLQIPENIINDTSRCRKDFTCLTEGECLCNVKHCLNRKSYLINPDQCPQCNYRVSTGSVLLCSCPTRKEIYNRYNI